jgi:hypothetical protein
MELAENNPLFLAVDNSIYCGNCARSLPQGTYMETYSKKASMAGISLDVFLAAFHHLRTSILGFRRFYQGKYDIGISDLRACGNNT